MNRPHIIKNDILATLETYERAVNEVGFHELDDRMQIDHIDLMAVKTMIAEAQVILFSAEQALALRPALKRFAEALEYHLPFPTVFIQFTQPIPEATFFTPEPSDQPEAGQFLEQLGLTDGDKICGIVLDQEQTASGQVINNAGAWFASTAVNRASWENRPDAHLRINPLTLNRENSQQVILNKQVLQLLAIAIVAYINCENITLERHAVDDKVNRKRLRAGKRTLDPYYICKISNDRDDDYRDGAAGQWTHSFRYDVRGHFRRLPNSGLIWVRPHQRGLEHELYKPKVYHVE